MEAGRTGPRVGRGVELDRVSGRGRAAGKLSVASVAVLLGLRGEPET